MTKQLLAWLTLLSTALLLPSSAEAQIAPTGAHYAGRPSDTGHVGPTDGGGFAASIPLDLPASRGGLPVPLQVVSGTKGFGAAGVDWDVPLSYVLVDKSFGHRRPAMSPGTAASGRERISISLLGRRVEMIPKGSGWIGRYAADLSMRKNGSTWVVADGNGLSYTFIQDTLLQGTGGPEAGSRGLWLLDSIHGSGGAAVQLRYDIGVVGDRTWPATAISIDLTSIRYNPDPSAGCYKHEVTLNYDGISIGAPMLSASVIGEVVVARWHKLTSVEVTSRASCGVSDTPQRLRKYTLAYAPDPDSRQQRLESVKVLGRQGTPEANVTLPVASYQYGTATTISNGVPVLRYAQTTSSLAIPVPSAMIAQTAKIGTSVFQPPVSGIGSGVASMQTFADYTGDGLPDFVFAQNGAMSIARGLSGMRLGAAVPLNGNVLPRSVLDVRTSDVDRFADESGIGLHNEYVWTQSIDVNGDGRIDVIDAAEQPETWVLYLNTPDPGPSGVKWVRRTVDVTRLHNAFRGKGLGTFPNYLPLGHRVTGRDHGEWACWGLQNGDYVAEPPANCPGFDPSRPAFAGLQNTFVEYEVTDLNGDGYPDVVFDSSPVGLTLESGKPDPSRIHEQHILNQNLLRIGPVGENGGPNRVLSVRNVRGVFVSNGSDPFSASDELESPSACGVGKWVGRDTLQDRVQSVECTIADVNGDGLADRIDGKGGFLLGTGFNFKTVRLQFPAAAPLKFLAVQNSDFLDTCPQNAAAASIAQQTAGLRDLTGDGIPDFVEKTSSGSRVFVGTGAGFAETPTVIEGPFAFSSVTERCDGTTSSTFAGLYDVNGDGKPDVVTLNAGSLVVSQLTGGAPGRPEAGRIVAVDNGYKAITNVSYGSAKDDPSTRHQVPFPEIVAISIATTGSPTLGGDLATTSYAYGDIDLFYDSTLDVFRPTGYRRRVELVSVPGTVDTSTQTAKIVDLYPLDPVTPNILPFLTDAQRFGRYLRAGQIRDVTVLAGGLVADPKGLLGIDVTTDSRRIAGVHHDVNTIDARLFNDSTTPADDVCKDIMFPYDFDLSSANSVGTYNPCSSRGFVYTGSSQSWRGSAAPPATQNVQVATSVRSIDDYGRATSTLYQNDIFRADDDLCVDVTYAAPTNLDQPVLTAISSRKVWGCGKGNAVLGQEYTEYDKQSLGLVSLGQPTSRTVVRYTADTGAVIRTFREFDADYDATGNPTKITSVREDGGKRTTQLSYDSFGLSLNTTAVMGGTLPVLVTTQVIDPISNELVGIKDPNGTVRGTTFDGFGRPLLDTISTPGDAAPGVLAARTYLGFDGVDPDGRHVAVKEFTDPVTPGNVGTAPGRTSTTYVDPLGRSRFTNVELGADYAKEILVVGMRTYDLLGRVVFEADAFPKSQNETTAYGTSRFFDRDGTLMSEIRGLGPQPYSTTPSASVERFPSTFRHTFTNHVETTVSQAADGLTTGAQQYGVTREATSTAIGRVLTRSTWQNGTRLEHEALGYDQLGQFSTFIRYQDAAGASNPVTTSMQLDSLGQILWLNEPMSAPQERTYSDWGQLKAVTTYPPNPEPTHGTLMSYDELGRLTDSAEQNGGLKDAATVSKFQYDLAGSSPFVTPTYLAGRLSSAATATSSVVMSYDGYGRVASRTFTDDKYTTYFEQHGFHGDGSQAWMELRLPDGGYKSERLDYAYDTAGRTRWMWFSDGSNTQELYNASTLDAWGRVRSASYGTTKSTVDYADLGRRLPQKIAVHSALGDRAIAFNEFDAVGREISRDEDLPNQPGHEIQSYDPLGRLQGTRRTLGAMTTSLWTFSYDPLGNVANLNDQLGTADATLSYLTSDRDRICGVSYVGTPGSCNVEHDSFGNIVYEPTRTGYNKLSFFNSGDVRRIDDQAGTSATFQYDAFGDVQDLLIVKGSTELRHDRNFGAFITARAQKGPGASVLYVSRKFPGPGLALSRRGPKGPWIYEFSESRGTRFTTDETGKFVQDNSYTPFGQPKVIGAAPGAAEFTNEQWNGGDALDGFGLVRLGKRLYDPSLGRFLSRDPLIIPRTATTSNPYAFSLNDPMNLSDPTGLDPCSMTVNCIGATNGQDPRNTGTGAALLAIGAWTIGQLWGGSEPKTPDARARLDGSAALAIALTSLALDQYDAYQLERGLMNLNDRPLEGANWILFAAAGPWVRAAGLARVAVGYGVISAPDEGSALFAALGLRSALAPGARPQIAPPETVTVYRAEGMVNQRILINGGNVTLQGDKMLFVSLGNAARTEAFLAKRLAQGMSDASIKSFKLSKSFADDVAASAVPERMAARFPNAPLAVDVTKGAGQFGLRATQIEALKKAIIQGSGR